jgi:hypothetical protein
MTIYETDTNLHKFYDGSAWRGVGEFVSYTPTLTNMTIGDGTISASYTRVGALVYVKGIITAGSTTTLDSSATDTVTVSRPVALSGVAGFSQVSSGEIFDDSTGIIYHLSVKNLSAGIIIARTVISGASIYLSSERIQSGTWSIAVDDSIRFYSIYEGVLT